MIVDALVALAPQGVPRLDEVSVNRAVVAFGAALSLVTTVLFGVFPAVQTSRRTTAQALRQGSRGILGRGRASLRGGLVVGQIALAMVLLAGSALLLRSFALLRGVDPGFQTREGARLPRVPPRVRLRRGRAAHVVPRRAPAATRRPSGSARGRSGRGPAPHRQPLQHLVRRGGAPRGPAGAAALDGGADREPRVLPRDRDPGPAGPILHGRATGPRRRRSSS